MKGYIYKWTNTVTKKNYIGKTCNKDCRYNWFLDFNVHYAGPHIDKARKKYNDIKYWIYDTLYECSGETRKELEEKLNEQEKKYIALYQANNKELGYNISSGGTFGDTFCALTDKERKARTDKQSKTSRSKQYKWMTNNIEQKKVDKDHQQEYLDNGWWFGMTEQHRNKISNSVKNSELCKIASKNRRISDEEKERRKIELEREKQAYRQTEEYKEKIKTNREEARQRRIVYNKSEEHRKLTSESNRNRYKNGCPNETRQRLKESSRKRWDTIKVVWINNGIISKMVDITELEKYIEQGFKRGRLK